jgi:hypothetical protein
MVVPAERRSAERADWMAALHRFTPIPAGHRCESVDAAEASSLLRCSTATLDRLVGAGLPCACAAGSRRFDPHDLYNLALASGSHRSIPELTTSIVVRLSEAPLQAWLEPRRWHFSVELGCPREDCGARPDWGFALPQPELAHGRSGGWETTRGPGRCTVSGMLETRGEQRSLRSRRLRAITRTLIADYRFHSLPESLEADVAALRAGTVVNCVGAGVLLADEFVAAGYDAVARKGYLLGVLGFAVHGWVEVVDDDGERKRIDPVLAMVAQRSTRPSADFAELCLGSVLNRVVPSAARPGEPLASHDCDGTRVDPGVRSQVTPAYD